MTTMVVERPVTVAGRRLEAVELAGDPSKSALVLLHEGLGSVGLWRGFPQALHAATGRRVIAFSRFGHGRSEPPPLPRTPAFFHEEALEVLPEVLLSISREARGYRSPRFGRSVCPAEVWRHNP